MDGLSEKAPLLKTSPSSPGEHLKCPLGRRHDVSAYQSTAVHLHDEYTPVQHRQHDEYTQDQHRQVKYSLNLHDHHHRHTPSPQMQHSPHRRQAFVPSGYTRAAGTAPPTDSDQVSDTLSQNSSSEEHPYVFTAPLKLKLATSKNSHRHRVSHPPPPPPPTAPSVFNRFIVHVHRQRRPQTDTRVIGLGRHSRCIRVWA